MVSDDCFRYNSHSYLRKSHAQTPRPNEEPTRIRNWDFLISVSCQSELGDQLAALLVNEVLPFDAVFFLWGFSSSFAVSPMATVFNHERLINTFWNHIICGMFSTSTWIFLVSWDNLDICHVCQLLIYSCESLAIFRQLKLADTWCWKTFKQSIQLEVSVECSSWPCNRFCT